MKVLERIKTKISKLVLIDSFVLPGENRSYAKTTNWEFDFKKIRSNTEEIVSLVDSTHAVVSAERQQGMSENLQAATVVRTPVEDHFCAEQEPEILKLFEQTGWIPLPESELPLELPKVKKYEPTDTGESPLAAMDKWVNTKCPRCGGKARRETDTMPNWAGSSWYFLRYIDPKNNKALASKEALQYWTPVDWYNGGMEHTVLHLLYSRFWNQFLFDIGVVPTREPYKKRTSHGMILGPDGEKMSKSRGNVINPDEMVEQFGADAFRSYIMFMGPFDQFVQWDTNGLVGVRRFIDRVWNLQDVLVDGSSNEQVIMHQTIKKVGEDIDKMSFNTAIAKLMELVNHFSKEQKISREEYGIFAKLLSPFAPHVAEEIWSKVLGNKKTIAYEAWPTFRSELTVDSTLTLAIQINGKVRDTLDVPAAITEEQVKELVLKSEKVQKWLEGKSPKKIIYIKGKLVSVVI
jgi:leucyl-tRNA synthetase